ncbi:WD40-repeat-containing domain protein [Ephemerocybe angulata]|uniref:WD40-repeat-containing domain protein n=1 Tax=Ephemerocybe angulata TaxID=980116 RepID=A0A8H6ME13_9AGAR|nr:WD40-repeat-containing domain protein [Tulosesus angulatus]
MPREVPGAAMSSLIDLTGSDEEVQIVATQPRPTPFNPPSAIRITQKERKRKHNPDVLEIRNPQGPNQPPKKRRLPQANPSVIEIPDDGPSRRPLPTVHPSRRTQLPDPTARLQEASRRKPTSSSTSRSQSATATASNRASTSRPTPAIGPQDRVYIISDEDEPGPRQQRENTSRRQRQSNVFKPTPRSPPPPPRSKIATVGSSSAQGSSQRRQQEAPRPNAQAGPSRPPQPPLVTTRRSPGLFEKHDLEAIETEKDYESYHGGLHWNNPTVWDPIACNVDKLAPVLDDDSFYTDEDTESEKLDKAAKVLEGRLERSKQTRRAHMVYPRPNVQPQRQDGYTLPLSLMDIIQTARNYKRGTFCLPRPLAPWEHNFRRPPLMEAFNLKGLKSTAKWKDCPGSIQAVDQKNGWVAIGGAVKGGTPDGEGETRIDPYNRSGSLSTYWNQRAEAFSILKGHTERRFGSDKYYAVNDVKFDPTDAENSFVSSGNDRKLHRWTRTHSGTKHRFEMLHKFNGVPHALTFKPGTSTLAVAEKCVYIFPSVALGTELTVFQGEYRGQVIGEMRWGANTTVNHLFASSEPVRGHPVYEGVHRAYDVNGTRTRAMYKFDAGEAGDCMAVGPSGSNLFLVTREDGSTPILRLYDIQRKMGRAQETITMEPYAAGLEGEVHDASVSPDGIYIAFGRYDNRTHVYDTRYLPRDGSPLYDFRHDDNSLKTHPGDDAYGVMKLEWIMSGSRLALLTGGGDGCVRLWDPLRASSNPENGAVVASMDFDIATFSVGDRFKGEHQLIVGDCSGEVRIYDRFFDEDFQRFTGQD